MCDRSGSGPGRRSVAESRFADSEAGLTKRTAVRAVIAVGAYVAQDMRDRDGITRPMLRRAALRMAVSTQSVLRRLGAAYLHADPPAAQELPAVTGARLPTDAASSFPAAQSGDEVIDVDPATVEDADERSETRQPV